MADPHLVQELRLRLRHRPRLRLRRPPRQFLPDPIERAYAAAIKAIINRVREAYLSILAPQLQGLVNEASAVRPDSARADAWAENAARVIAAMKLRIGAGRADPERLTTAFGEDLGRWQDRQWKKVLKATVGVELFSAEPWLRDHIVSWAKENAGLIKTLEDKTINDVERWTLSGLREGQRHEAIGAKIAERLEVSASHAEFIARDQTAKLNGQIAHQRQVALGVEEYVWRTAGDDRVRESHAEKEGQTFRWDDPPADTGHPGEDYQCRCTAEPVLAGVLATAEEGA